MAGNARYDISMRLRAVELFDSGMGSRVASRKRSSLREAGWLRFHPTENDSGNNNRNGVPSF